MSEVEGSIEGVKRPHSPPASDSTRDRPLRREELRSHPEREYVPRGDPALTRALLARGALRVIDERRGKLVQVGVAATPASIEAARAAVAATAGRRAVQRERSRERRARQEEDYIADFDAAVRRLYPSIPDRDREEVVARTCEVGSRRVGRSAAARALDDDPIRLAVRAWIRHGHTDYDARLERAGAGRPFGRASKEARLEARRVIRPRVEEVAAAWARPRPIDATPAPAPRAPALAHGAPAPRAPRSGPPPAAAPRASRSGPPPAAAPAVTRAARAPCSPPAVERDVSGAPPLWSRGLAGKRAPAPRPG